MIKPIFQLDLIIYRTLFYYWALLANNQYLLIC